MPIKVKILNENKEKINEMMEMLTPEILAAIAAGLGVAVPVVKSMFKKKPSADDEFKRILAKPMSTERDLSDVRKYIAKRQKKADKIPKSTPTQKALDRLAQLKTERGLNEQLLKESIVADVVNFISQNPVLLGLGAVALGTLVSKIKNVMSSEKEMSYSDIQKVFADAGIPTGEQLRLEKELSNMKARAKFKKLKAEYEAKKGKSEFDPSKALPQNPDSGETGLSIPIDSKDLKMYVDIMNRVSRGEGGMENVKLQKLIDKYGKENLDKAAEGMLYEIFKRFM